ncbi:hypothetical protein Plim_1079 [Planctopirus limnophila DSM 3776]|uniref:Uncharacterized protein n=1 Tax=Planctopirus limnophila (strain ATCC 43296 / DSM 3776 / IFAM 1008 / Mu 290) TaxID=521674 RepID=D5STT1_PLAL2|nr:hypothetical protein Plim_1079 [Planctopirus limnophila DSM 3776]
MCYELTLCHLFLSLLTHPNETHLTVPNKDVVDLEDFQDMNWMSDIRSAARKGGSLPSSHLEGHKCHLSWISLVKVPVPVSKTPPQHGMFARQSIRPQKIQNF